MSESKSAKEGSLPNNKEVILENLTTNITNEFDTNNPWGPNYTVHPLYWRLYTKYIKMMTHVKVLEEDKQLIETSKNLYYTSLAGSGLSFYTIFEIYSRFRLRKNPRYNLKKNMKNTLFIILGICMLHKPFFMYTFFKYDYPLLDKYMQQAVNNGFDDYKVKPRISFDESLLKKYLFSYDISDFDIVNKRYLKAISENYKIVKPEQKFMVNSSDMFPLVEEN